MPIDKATVIQSSVTIGDPHICSDSVNRLSVIFNVYDTLVMRDDKGYYHPSLAESWFVDENARNWTFKLRVGVKFHNGDVLRASDVVATLERVLDPSRGGAFGTQGVYRSYLGNTEISAVARARIGNMSEKRECGCGCIPAENSPNEGKVKDPKGKDK